MELAFFKRNYCWAALGLVCFGSFGCESKKGPIELAQVKLIGTPGVTVEIFRLDDKQSTDDASQGASPATTPTPFLGRGSPESMVPLGTIAAGKSYSFPGGNYYAVNSCSAVYFELKKDSVLSLNLQRVELTTPEDMPFRFFDVINQETKNSFEGIWKSFIFKPDEVPSVVSGSLTNFQKRLQLGDLPQVIPTECTHPLSGVREAFSTRREFEILPGQVTLSIGGRRLIQDLLQNQEMVHRFELFPVIAQAGSLNVDANVFSTPLDETSRISLPVVSAPVGNVLWLPGGRYTLEINGTRYEVDLKGKEGVAISLGALMLKMPKDFPLRERLKRGGQPPFAYINDGVLFTMDTAFLVFPGNYTINLDGSDVKTDVTAYSAEISIVQTKGAVVQIPSCPAESKTGCKSPSAITLHAQQKPFVLLTVEPGVPFLVLEDEYEYGVEGVRGVLKRLTASDTGAAPETLARIQFKWQVVQAAARVRTDLVRLETKGEKIFGKSLDFLFTEPKEIYVPPGQYELTYLVGDPALERNKVKRPLNLLPGSTTEVTVPIYTDKMNPSEIRDREKEEGSSDQQAKAAPLPRRLKPLGK